MTDQDLIRRAVALADGWIIEHNNIVRGFVQSPMTNPSQMMLDALAAQLTRQVDALSPVTCSVYITPNSTTVYTRDNGKFTHEHKRASGMRPAHDRTMNTLRAIVESGVLE